MKILIQKPCLIIYLSFSSCAVKILNTVQLPWKKLLNRLDFYLINSEPIKVLKCIAFLQYRRSSAGNRLF